MSSYDFYSSKNLDAGLLMSDSKPAERGRDYFPSKELIQAVNVALLLQKPLLLTGPPGTGKTELAYHLAYHFGWGEPEYFPVRTDSTYTDLLYRYDSLAHFHKVNIARSGENKSLSAEPYIHYVALGKAICDSVASEGQPAKRTVVLIDEIDKAPRDLPNDILSYIERMEFEVPELMNSADNAMCKKTGDPLFKPVVILTSNSEKSLPDAFLRRCVFFHIEMPKPQDMLKILLRKTSILKDLDESEANGFIAFFDDLSRLIKGKKPATHELILWVWWMRKRSFTVDQLRRFDKKSEYAAELLSGVSILAKETSDWKAVTKAIRDGAVPADSGGKSNEE